MPHSNRDAGAGDAGVLQDLKSQRLNDPASNALTTTNTISAQAL